MVDQTDIIELAREAANKSILFLPHAIRQMSRPDTMITTADIRRAIFEGEVIEDYPEDARGHSCLVLGEGERPIHIVCSPKAEYLAIITAYLSDKDEWSIGFRVRL